jgi:hypothetical protein
MQRTASCDGPDGIALLEITVITEHDGWYGAGPDKTTITEVGDSPAVTLALGKRKREDEQQ